MHLPLLALLSNVLAPGLSPTLVVQNGQQKLGDRRVTVELGVMSRCPDALLCESVFNEVLPKVADKVDLSLLYIGKPNSTDQDFGITCLHGPEECAGNVQQLCVAKYAPSSTWWEFVQCQNYEGRYRVGSPDLALKCAEAVGIDWVQGGAGQCAGLDGSGKGEEGVRLLRESVESTQTRGIVRSCTVLIQGQQVCIHDGTWKSCEINEEYERLNVDA
ncbi:hypothetical protein BDN72DRAFT_356691 [Pluteus cervinus]|uniref:Uncharacterized protein n=1 Tax=Pluteus cervinus TaxID=181527 RepID=A0ACD3BDW8_9AGAR|nr:hypothetical protein BDN72DRAFT_356691 [Pluteus cervinus]